MSWISDPRSKSSYKNIFETGLDLFPLYPAKRKNSQSDKQKSSSVINNANVKDNLSEFQNHTGTNQLYSDRCQTSDSSLGIDMIKTYSDKMSINITGTSDKSTTMSPNKTKVESQISPKSESSRYLVAVQKYNNFMESMGSSPTETTEKIPCETGIEKKTKIVIKRKEGNQYEAILNTSDSDINLCEDPVDSKGFEKDQPREPTVESSPKQPHSELASNNTFADMAKQNTQKSLDLTEEDTRNINDLLHMLRKVGNKYVLEFYKHLKQFSLGLRPEFFKKYPMVAILLGLNTADPEQQQFNYSKAKLILAYIHNHPLLKAQLSMYQQSHSSDNTQHAQLGNNNTTAQEIHETTVNQPSTKSQFASGNRDQLKAYHQDNQSVGQSLPTFGSSFRELKSPRNLSYEYNEQGTVQSDNLYANSDKALLQQYYNSPQQTSVSCNVNAVSDKHKHYGGNIQPPRYEENQSGPKYAGQTTSNIRTSGSDLVTYNSGRQYSCDIVHSNSYNVTGQYTSEEISPKSVFKNQLSPHSVSPQLMSQSGESPKLMSSNTQGTPYSFSTTQVPCNSTLNSQGSPINLMPAQSKQSRNSTPMHVSPSKFIQAQSSQLNQVSPNKRKMPHSPSLTSPPKRKTFESSKGTQLSPQKSPQQSGFLESFQSFLKTRDSSADDYEDDNNRSTSKNTLQIIHRSQNKLSIHLSNAVQITKPNQSVGYLQDKDKNQSYDSKLQDGSYKQARQQQNSQLYPDTRKNNQDNTLMNFSQAFSTSSAIANSVSMSQSQYQEDTKPCYSSAQQTNIHNSQINVSTTIKTEPQSHDFVKVENKHCPTYMTGNHGYKQANENIPTEVNTPQHFFHNNINRSYASANYPIDKTFIDSKPNKPLKSPSKKSPKKVKNHPSVPLVHGIADYPNVQTTPLVDRLAYNSSEQIPNCNCLNTAFDELVEGPYYTHLGAGANVAEIRSVMENRLGVTGSALRIEKILYTGKEGKNPEGCPIAKWVIRRSGPDEKVLVIARPRKGHSCSTAVIIAGICIWDGVVQQQADMLYDYMRDVLPKYGNETERRCGTNEKRTCACQGWDGQSCGASFSFGCSWSMYYNGCKFARSHTPRKFRLQKQCEEAAIDHQLQTLVTQLSPLYKQAAPDSYNNMVHFEDVARDCRIGYQKGSPFSGVTAVVDFSTHSHKDTNNMNNGCTMVVTLTKHRGFDKPEDEQLHVLPLCIMDTTDENNSHEGQYEKIRNGSIEYLTKYSMKMRVRSFPLLPCKQRKKLGKNVVGYGSGIRGRKPTISSKVKAAKKVVKNCLSNIRGQVRDKVFMEQKCGTAFSATSNKPSSLGIYSNENYKSYVKKASKFGQMFKQKFFTQKTTGLSSHAFHKYKQDLNPYPKWKYGQYNVQPQQLSMEQMYSGAQPYLAQHQWNSSQFNFMHNHMQWQQWMRMKQVEDYQRQRTMMYSPVYQNSSVYGPMKYGQEAMVNPLVQHPGTQTSQAHGQEMRSTSLSGQMHGNVHQVTGLPQELNNYQPQQLQNVNAFDTSNQKYSYPVQSAVKSEHSSSCIKQDNITPACSTSSGSNISFSNSGINNNQCIKSAADYTRGSNSQSSMYNTGIKSKYEHSQCPANPSNTIIDIKQPLFSHIKQEIDHEEVVQQQCQGNSSVVAAEANDVNAGTIVDDPMEGAKEVYTDCEQSFQDSDIGGVAIALTHGSVLFECARKELHATTAMKKPNRYHPTRISLVFYQHKNLNLPKHGYEQYLEKAEIWKQRREAKKLEKEAAEAGYLNEGALSHHSATQAIPNDQQLPLLGASKQQGISKDYQLPVSTSHPQVISNDYQIPPVTSKPMAISSDYQLSQVSTKPQTMSNDYCVSPANPTQKGTSNDYYLPQSAKSQAIANDHQLPKAVPTKKAVYNDYHLPQGTSKPPVIATDYQVSGGGPTGTAFYNDFHLPLGLPKQKVISNDYQLPQGFSKSQAISNDYHLPKVSTKQQEPSNDYRLPYATPTQKATSNDYELPKVSSKQQEPSNHYRLPYTTPTQKATSNDYQLPKVSSKQQEPYATPTQKAISNDYLLPQVSKPQAISKDYQLQLPGSNQYNFSQSGVVNDKTGLVPNFMNHKQGQMSTFTGHEKQSVIQSHNFYQ